MANESTLGKRIENVETELHTLKKQSSCEHKYIQLVIERRDGWICTEAECAACGKRFRRKGYYYINKKTRTAISKLFGF